MASVVVWLMLSAGCAGRVVEPLPQPPPPEPLAKVESVRPEPRKFEVSEPVARKTRNQGRAKMAKQAEAAARADAAAVERQIVERSRGASGLKLRLLRHFEDWQGVPYRYGGMSKSGIDCSGFVALTFRSQLGVDLPRTTAAQVKEGKSVAKRNLQTGDLVFFRPERGRRHVGIYLADGEFIHSGTTLGVGKSRLDNPYWAKRYWQARRVGRRGR